MHRLSRPSVLPRVFAVSAPVVTPPRFLQFPRRRNVQRTLLRRRWRHRQRRDDDVRVPVFLLCLLRTVLLGSCTLFECAGGFRFPMTRGIEIITVSLVTLNFRPRSRLHTTSLSAFEQVLRQGKIQGQHEQS